MMILTGLYGPVYRQIIFPFYDSVIRRRKTYSYYREISGAPYLPVDELERMRRERLGSLLEYCGAKVPFYRRLFAERGFDPAGVDDVRKLAEHGISLSKDDIRAHGSDLISEDYTRDQLVRNYTSGTTGMPVDLYKTVDEWCLRMAIKLRSEEWIGMPLGTPAARIWGRKPNMGPWARARHQLYWNFQNFLFLSAHDLREEVLLRYVRWMKLYGARFIEGYINPIDLIAGLIERDGLEPPRLDGIVVGGQRLEDYQKEKIEGAFRCPVYNRYGCSEVTNISCECKRQEGQHVNYDTLWVEVVDGNDRPVVGEPGEVVVTDLMNRSMPYLRYRTRDQAVMSDRKCSCGRNFPMLEKVIGKTIEHVITAPDGFKCDTKFIQWGLYDVPGIYRFQVVDRSGGDMLMKVIADGTVAREKIVEGIGEAFSELREHGIGFTVDFVDEIPLTDSGKMMYFVSEKDD